MFSGFVVFFRCLRFLGCRFSRSFVMLFRRLSFLRSSWFSCYFFVFFSGLGFLSSGWFSFCFFVFFGSLSFLLCGRFCRGFVVFFCDGWSWQPCCGWQPVPEWCLLRQQRKRRKRDP
ncbi:Uncharacterised protein [Klebsiella pneumoniae]|uniref:Uncharacterized protein n=1 Tax=Klebsiella pneumoniae TaxID=573 RepID=A0A377WIP4_KLEPN|nr:Uncharacterised protein [Klebsiella pneumoniae]